MRKLTVLSARLMSAPVTIAPASFAQRSSGYCDSQHVSRAYHHTTRKSQRLERERARQNASNRGAVLGGLGGAVLGSAIAGRGAKTEGAIIGAVGGVLTGRQLAKKNHRC